MLKIAIKLILQLITLLLIINFLTGCEPKPEPIIIEPAVALPYKPLSPMQSLLLSKIRCAGVQVIRQGDTLRMIFPIDKFFVMPTTHLRLCKTPAIKLSAKFVQAFLYNYPRSTVYVLGFSDKVYSRSMRLETSEQYALVIASYLWNTGIARSRIDVQGLGSTQSVATYRDPAGNSMNRRVEIRINFQ